jgi:hypothetical protein
MCNFAVSPVCIASDLFKLITQLRYIKNADFSRACRKLILCVVTHLGVFSYIGQHNEVEATKLTPGILRIFEVTMQYLHSPGSLR